MKRIIALSLVAALLGPAAAGAFAADLTEKQQTAIRQEVGQAMQGFIEALNRADIQAVFAAFADSPDFLFADMEGKVYDLAGAKQALLPAFAGYTSAKHFPAKTKSVVLGPNTALCLWNGSGDCFLKDGTVVKYGAITFTCLYQRLGDAWKILHFQETVPPPQPPPTATTATTFNNTVPPAKWSADQRTALGVLESACEALGQGTMEKLTPLYHERFVGWDLAQPLPSARAAFMEEEAAFLKSVKSVESKVTPIMIEIVGDTAALQVTFRNTVAMADGKRQVSTGRWSTTLVKNGGAWLFLSSAYLADK